MLVDCWLFCTPCELNRENEFPAEEVDLTTSAAAGAGSSPVTRSPEILIFSSTALSSSYVEEANINHIRSKGDCVLDLYI